MLYEDKNAPNYEEWGKSSAEQWIFAQECDLIRRMVKPRIGESILDIGCGPGFHLRVFHEWNMRAIGIDASPEMVELAKKNVDYAIPVFEGFGENLPFPSRHFDTVIFVTSLEFMDSPSEALREAFRVARSKVVVVVLNAFSLGAVGLHIDTIFKSTLYQPPRLFSLWKLKKLIRRETLIGRMSWGSSPFLPDLIPLDIARAKMLNPFDSPFARYIAVCMELAIAARRPEPARRASLMEKVPSWAQRSLRIQP